jgi:hypothetical protein
MAATMNERRVYRLMVMLLVFIYRRREESPNDRKLSDTPERRGTCMVGGKAVVEAGAVTRRRVR